MKIINNIKTHVRRLKEESQVLIIAYADKRTPASAKILIGLTVGYLLCPIDLIPDFIPILGLVDDIIIVPILIYYSIKLIPETVLIEARLTAQNNPQKLKKNNWWFAMLIVLIWLCVLSIFLKKFKLI